MVITTILLISFQLLYYGVSTYYVDTLIGMIIVALGYALISTFKISQVKKCIYMGFDIYFNNIIKTSLKKGEKLSFLMLDIDLSEGVIKKYSNYKVLFVDVFFCI